MNGKINKKIITLKKLTADDAEKWFELQKEAFIPFLIKYQDYETNPAVENIEKILWRFNQTFIHHYFILHENEIAGGIRVSRWEDLLNLTRDTTRYRLNCMFIRTEFQNSGIGQQALKMVESLYPEATSWELNTLLQEKRNLHFYEKLGYKREGEEKVINDKLSTVFYKKYNTQ